MTAFKLGDGMKLCLQTAFAMSVFVVSASDMSEGVPVYRDPSDYALWHTATNSTFELFLDYSPFATEATVEVHGVKFERAYSNVTAQSFVVSVPRPIAANKEDVYRIDVTYNDGTSHSARVGVVRGHGVGNEPECGIPVVVADEKCSNTFVTPRVVVPVPPSAEGTFFVNGDVVDTGLNGCRGWFALGPAKAASSYTVQTGDSSASLEAVGLGFLLYVK